MLLALLASPAGVQAVHWSEDEAAVAALFAELDPPLEIERVERPTPARRIHRLRSSRAVGRAEAGALYARAWLEATVLTSPEQARAEVGRRFAEADPDTGWSYGWDFVASAGERVLHLHADCTLAEESFRRVAARLADRISGIAEDRPAFWCRCGGGCRPGGPDDDAAPPRRSLPAVGHPDRDGEGYDDRLDPSGTWSGELGSLSLMHDAGRLSFSYLAVFGPTAHVCEGAGVAGLVGPDRYEHVDGQGTVALVVEARQVRLELVDGIASFCGAGWSGDRFAIESWEPPLPCEVAAEATRFRVVDVVDPELRPARALRGERVEAVAVQHPTEPELLLARRAAGDATVVGLLPADALRCGPEPAP